jgi:hypothetical protein
MTPNRHMFCSSIYWILLIGLCGCISSPLNAQFTGYTFGSANDFVPAPWVGADIGSPGATGSTYFDSSIQDSLNNVEGGTYDLSGAGSIGGGSDSFHFVHQEISGDITLIARVAAQTGTSSARAGIMIRQSLTNTSYYAAMLQVPSGNGAYFQYRDASYPSGGSAKISDTSPYWLGLVRSGSTVTAYAAPDESNSPGTWVQVGSSQAFAEGTAYIGLSVSSGRSGTLATANLDNVSVSNTQAMPADTFVSSIGVCTHWGWSGTVWSINASNIESSLIASGIRHDRDDSLVNTTYLAQNGVTTTLINGDNDGTNMTTAQVEAIPGQIISAGAGAVDAVEGPNEADLEWGTDTTYNGVEYPTGTLNYQEELYNVIAGNSQTKTLPVYMTPSGGEDAWSAGAATGATNFGNTHAYQWFGNPGSNVVPFAYDTIPNYLYASSNPSVMTDEYPYYVSYFYPQTEAHPMVATETGYFNGTSQYSVDTFTAAKYVPRNFAEFFRRGIQKTFYYEFMDEGWNADGSYTDTWDPTVQQDNYGLVEFTMSGTPTVKPAYTALQSLISLLSDKGSAFTPGSLSYQITVNPPSGYNRTWYVRNLLLQKRSGTYYLVLWHEISDSSFEDTSGNMLSGTQRDIRPPAMPTTISLPSVTGNVTVYTYNTSTWQFTSSVVPVTSGQLSLNATDTLTIIAIP